MTASDALALMSRRLKWLNDTGRVRIRLASMTSLQVEHRKHGITQTFDAQDVFELNAFLAGLCIGVGLHVQDMDAADQPDAHTLIDALRAR